jgi:hypothetical protein
MKRDALHVGPTIRPRVQEIRLAARDVPQGSGGGM